MAEVVDLASEHREAAAAPEVLGALLECGRVCDNFPQERDAFYRAYLEQYHRRLQEGDLHFKLPLDEFSLGCAKWCAKEPTHTTLLTTCMRACTQQSAHRSTQNRPP